jgi:excisionase family DNA binding protein
MKTQFTPQGSPASPAALITRHDVARLASVSPRTIDRWVDERRIPAIKIGRTIRFRWPAVETALMRFERKAVS